MNRVGILGIAFALAVLVGAAPALAAGAQTVTVVASQSVDGGSVLDTCTGQPLTLAGSLLEEFHTTTTTADNFFVIDSHFNPQGVTGLAPDGTLYHGIGVTDSSTRIKWDTLGTPEFHDVLQTVSVFAFVGPGSRYAVRAVIHYTYANGQLVAYVGNFTTSC